jgi:hypothetical protein
LQQQALVYIWTCAAQEQAYCGPTILLHGGQSSEGLMCQSRHTRSEWGRQQNLNLHPLQHGLLLQWSEKCGC